MQVFNPNLLQTAGKDIEIELGIAPREAKRADVNKALQAVGLNKTGECF